ncbi:hypothetical protein HRG_002228 [Hirsutella rhossiliensis]|uniref:Uncharacterized protein n=1 Tax=Hirsutella rhossiliensis TaxID=111463 RepID=A0A9P8N4T6_9HYPO|nr:uncharacterized protein HRG_02228 [Hirsutella rhossiliensis]KAH0966819.1 hypothetical protein HRG_02228 [Hirsutella rhossiliensis]
MSEPHSTSPTKRRHSPSAGRAAKVPRPSEPRMSPKELPPASFYTDLSVQHLTRSALRRLDTENRALQIASYPPPAMTGITLPIDMYLAFCIPELRDQLQKIARNGGLDLSDLRGHRNQMTTTWSLPESNKCHESGAPIKTNSTPATSSSKATGPFDDNFQQHLADSRVLALRIDNFREDALDRPDNINALKRAIARPRPRTLALSKIKQGFYDSFLAVHAQAVTKAHVMANVIPLIEGEAGGDHRAATGIPFTNLEYLTQEPIVAGQPDIFYGAPPDVLVPELRDLRNMIVPSVNNDVPVLPNFFVSVTSPGGDHSTAMRQACYHGALGARGMQSLQSYKQPDPEFDSNTYTLTSIYHRGRLEMYATHLTRPVVPGQLPGYAMTPVGQWSLNASPDTFRRGVLAWRNGRDWAQRQREDALKQALYVAREWMLT